MAITPGVRSIVGVFGPMLQAAERVGRGAAAMWAAYTEAYASLGQERPPATLQDMNTFVAGLGGLLRAEQELGAAGDETALTSAQIAQVPWIESTLADYANPRLTATFQAIIQTEEGLVTRWSSVAYNTVFPATVGQLRQESLASIQNSLDESAMQEGEESPTAGGLVVGIGDMYIIGRGVGQ